MPYLNDPAPGVPLREILHGSIVGADDIHCSACCADPSQCEPGDVYFAIADAPLHDLRLIEMAVERGARAVVAEQLIPTKVPVMVVANVKRDFALVCNALAGAPQQRMDLIAVSGTTGKRVTSTLIHSIAQQTEDRCALLNSAWTSNGVRNQRSASIPSAPDLNKWLSDSLSTGCRTGVLEVSSQSLLEHHFCAVDYDAAVLTNVGKDQFDVHDALEASRSCAQRLFRQLKPEGVAVLNADDRFSQQFLDNLSHPALTVSLKGAAELTAEILERHISEQTFLMRAGSEAVPVRTRMIGDQHVLRCLQAAAVGLARGSTLDQIVRGLEAVENVTGQMQRLECGQPFSTFVHHSPNAQSLREALMSARRTTSGRVLCVFSADPHCHRDSRSSLGRAAERYTHVPFITSDDYTDWDQSYELTHQVLDGFQHPSQARIVPTREAAVVQALEAAETGDTVVIASQGGQHDIDAEFAKHLLYEQARSTPRSSFSYSLGASMN